PPIPTHHGDSAFYINERVAVESMNVVGTLKFLGETQFKEGIWAGIQLDVVGKGKNDGSVGGYVHECKHCVSISCAPDETVMRLQQLQLRVEVLEAENKFLKLENTQNKTAEQILERSLTLKKNNGEHMFTLESHKSIMEETDRVKGLEETVEELKRAGMESIELYESSVQMNRVDMEAMNASLADERRKIASLENEREDLRKAGLEAIEAYEANIEEMKKERAAIRLERMTVQHATEMRESRERSENAEKEHKRQISLLNKDISDLESMIESKVFREADLEEALENERKQVKKLLEEVEDLK
ncbi:hypothetical protein BDB01DRAFT_700330, partial [Pilobolus umbonatus]